MKSKSIRLLAISQVAVVLSLLCLKLGNDILGVPHYGFVIEAEGSCRNILHEPVFMKKALKEACRLGNQIACDDIKNLINVNEHDFGLLVID